jgi:hypothetical protein
VSRNDVTSAAAFAKGGVAPAGKVSDSVLLLEVWEGKLSRGPIIKISSVSGK